MEPIKELDSLIQWQTNKSSSRIRIDIRTGMQAKMAKKALVLGCQILIR